MADRILKLALWHTKTFTPILTHEELESIMATIGFGPVPITTNRCNSVEADGGSVNSGTTWKEYSYSISSSFNRWSDPPRPKLPYPIIDGLHICTYHAFMDSVNFYLRFNDDLSDIFHIRGMTLNRVGDRSENWIRMEENDNYKTNVYVYREGLYDILAYNTWNAGKNDLNKFSNKLKGFNSNVFYGRGNILAGCKFVPMKDVVVQRLDNS